MPVHRGTGSPRGRRRSTSASTAADPADRLRWIPVDTLPPLARALLSDDLGGRDVVPKHVADRVSQGATRWAAHGFTAETVRPWTDLPPAAAAYLAERGVSPRVLGLPVMVSRSPVTLTLAISSGMLSVERAYQLLVATGEHREGGPAEPAFAADRPDRDGPAAPGLAADGTRQDRRPPAVPGTGGPREDGPTRPESEARSGQPPRRPVAQVIFSHGPGERREPVADR